MSPKNVLPDKCAIARDLMPLCVDGTASEASRRKVSKHVSDCPPCATVYQEMQTAIELDMPDQEETAQFETAVKKVKHKHVWRKLRNVLLGIVMALVVCAGLAYGYYWYFVEEVPLPIDLYEMELVLRLPQREETPMIIKTKNMPKPAKMQVEVHYDGSVMNEKNELEPSWVMYIWATTTRSVNLESCGYTDYTYYAFDQTYVDGSYIIGNQLYKVNTVYKGAITDEQVLLHKPDMDKVKFSAPSNYEVLRNVATLNIVGEEKVLVPFRADPLVTPMPTSMIPQDQVFVMYDEVQPAMSTPVPPNTQVPQVTQAPPVTAMPNGR